MFGIGMQELLIILVVALLVLGPTKLPSVARTIGKGMRELRRASDDLRTAMMVDLDEERPKRAPAPPPSSSLPAADGVEPAIHGSVVAGAEAVRAMGEGDASDAAPAAAEAAPEPDSLVRSAPGIVARGSTADPDDASDHSGMPYAADGPEVAKALEDAKARATEAGEPSRAQHGAQHKERTERA